MSRQECGTEQVSCSPITFLLDRPLRNYRHMEYDVDGTEVMSGGGVDVVTESEVYLSKTLNTTTILLPVLDLDRLLSRVMQDSMEEDGANASNALLTHPGQRQPLGKVSIENLVHFNNLGVEDATPLCPPPSPVRSSFSSAAFSKELAVMEGIRRKGFAAMERLDAILSNLENRNPLSDLRLRALRQRPKSADGLNQDVPWYSQLTAGELKVAQLEFVRQVEDMRARRPVAPRMPSLLNPVRRDAPPKTWEHIRNPYPSCKSWKVQAPLRPHSIQTCDQVRGDYLSMDPRTCSGCRRDKFRKSLLIHRARQWRERNPEPPLSPVYELDGKLFHNDCSFIDMDDIVDTSSIALDGSESDTDDDLEEVLIEPATRQRNAQDLQRSPKHSTRLLPSEQDSDELLASEFPFDYYNDVPRAPRLQDVDQFSDASSDDESMDFDDWPSTPYLDADSDAMDVDVPMQ